MAPSSEFRWGLNLNSDEGQCGLQMELLLKLMGAPFQKLRRHKFMLKKYWFRTLCAVLKVARKRGRTNHLALRQRGARDVLWGNGGTLILKAFFPPEGVGGVRSVLGDWYFFKF